MLADIVWNEKTIAVIGAFAVPISYTIMSYWYRLGRARSENALKREMVARGMTADEIERVIAAPKETD
jgi:hypothetical protein